MHSLSAAASLTKEKYPSRNKTSPELPLIRSWSYSSALLSLVITASRDVLLLDQIAKVSRTTAFIACIEGLITEKIPYEISKSWDFAKDFRISGKISRFH